MSIAEAQTAWDGDSVVPVYVVVAAVVEADGASDGGWVGAWHTASGSLPGH